MARTATTLLLLSVLALLVPAAVAKEPGITNPDASTPATLYMHLVDVQDFPINTQEPDDAWTQDSGYGMATSTTSCLPNGTPGADLSQAYHTFYGFSSPSYVEYLKEENGKPRIHPERGISYDAHVDTAAPFTIYWYLSVKGAFPTPDGSPASLDSIPLPTPNVVVQATMRAGDAVSVDDRGYNGGEVLAQGATVPATLVADQVLPAAPGLAPSPGVTALGLQEDGRWLYEFAVPMTVAQAVIPRASGYNLRIDVRMDNPACAGGDAALMPNTVAIHSSKDRRPRMELSITNPVRITALHPQFVGDDLVIHAAANAAWGNYDVAEPSPYTPDLLDGLTATIDGPTPATSFGLYRLVSETNPHYAHQHDVTVVYVWNHKADHAKPGEYTVTFTAKNDRGNAEAVATTTFEIGKNTAVECTAEGCRPIEPEDDGSRRQSPGLAPLALALALVGLAVGFRRRV